GHAPYVHDREPWPEGLPGAHALRAGDRRAGRGAAHDDDPDRRRSGDRQDRDARRGDVPRRVGHDRAAAVQAGRGGRVKRGRKLSGKVAIVGQGESDEHGKLPNKSAFQLHAESARNALADAGLTVKDVDAVFSAGLWMGSETAEYL